MKGWGPGPGVSIVVSKNQKLFSIQSISRDVRVLSPGLEKSLVRVRVSNIGYQGDI